MDHLPQERQHLLDRLLDAVKQCQVRFGGRTELATDSDSRVSCLCAQFEAVLLHGLKRGTINPLRSLQQMTGIIVPSIPLIKQDNEQAFWPIVRDNLTKHELQRYMSLKHITTDAGKARAWLRSTLNEHSLERYLHTLLGVPDMLRQYYEPWSFLLDDERSSMIPTMARGLGSILFAINIDKEELNGIKQGASLSSLIQTSDVIHASSMTYKDPEPVIVAGTAPSGASDKKERKRKKKKSLISIVSFNDDDSGSTVVTCGSPPIRGNRSRKDSTGKTDKSTRDKRRQNSCGAETVGFDVPVESTKIVTQTSNGESTNLSSISISTGHSVLQFQSVDTSLSAAEQIVADQASPSLRSASDSASTNTGNSELMHATRHNFHSDELSEHGQAPLHQSQPIQVQTGLVQNSQTKPANIPDPQNDRYNFSDRNRIDRTGTQLATSFPAKTPPPTPSNAVFASQFEQSALDPESVVDRLRQQEISSKTASESSSLDTDFNEGTPPRGPEVNDGIAPTSFPKRQSIHIIGGGDEDLEVPMYPVNEDSASQQDTQSTDSSMLGFGAETENAALGLLLAQRSLKESLENTMDPGTPEDVLSSYHAMTNDELKQAVLAMMNRNDDLHEQNRSLRSLIDGEMEHTVNIRGQLEELKCSSTETEEKLLTQNGALTRENEVLKHQLKKYVGAVQMLRRDGSQAIEGLPGIRANEPQPPIPEPKPGLLQSEVEQYQNKLIQVAEMHGELMEFNDYLSRQLKVRDNVIRRLQEELVDLRGPLPRDQIGIVGMLNAGNENESISSNQRALVNIWIPSAFLRGKGSDAYHVYQIYVRIRDEEWNVYRRYTEFRELHLTIRKNNAIINTFDFPPKKAVGNKDSKFVEERRKKLQHYIRCVVNFYVDNTNELTENPCKETLLRVLPFFMDEPTRKRARASSVKTNKLVAGRKQAPETLTYDGL